MYIHTGTCASHFIVHNKKKMRKIVTNKEQQDGEGEGEDEGH